MKSRGRRNFPAGFSLIESLVGLVVFFLIILGSFEFFGTVRTVFFRLQKTQENHLSIWVALEKIRNELRSAGQGLARPLRLGLIAGIEQNEEAWILSRADRDLPLAGDAKTGDTTLAVTEADEEMAGRTLCLFDAIRGETALITGAGDGRLTLSAPLRHGYRAGEAWVIIIRKISFYLDSEKGILRQKIDAAPAQPLLEDVQSFALSYDSGLCMAAARLSLKSAPEEFHGIKILARNAALGKTP